MKYRFSIRLRMFLAMFFAIVFVTLVLGYFEYSRAVDLLNQRVDKEFSDIDRLLHAQIETRLANLDFALDSLVQDPSISRMFAEGDRDGLVDHLSSYFAKIKRTNNISQFQFHEPNAHSFLRLHRPDKYGDDLSGFRKTVVAANRTKTTVRGLEVGRGGPGLRVVTPLSYEGTHLGTVEFGGDLISILDEMTGVHGYEYAVGITKQAFEDARRFDTEPSDVVKGNMVYYAMSEKEIRPVLMERGEGDTRAKVDGTKWAMFESTLVDYSGATVGRVVFFEDLSPVIAEMNRGQWINRFVGMGLAFIIAAMMFFIVIYLLMPLSNLARIIRELIGGKSDLSKRLPLRYRHNLIITPEGEVTGSVYDEVEVISVLMNAYLDNIDNSFANTLLSVADASENTMPISTAIVRVRDSVDENVGMANQVATASEEMSKTIMEIASNTHEVAQKAEDTIALAEEGGGMVRESADYSDEVLEAINNLGNQIGELTQNAEEVNNVVSVINDISEQTNLLALNAAIEAARAGEAGRGFAVVADEVRKLAEKTQHSTKIIEEMISQVKTGVEAAADSTTTVAEKVQKQHQIADAVAEKFTIILSSIQELGNIIMSTSTAVEEQSAATEEISRSIENVAETSNQTKTLVIGLISNTDTLIDSLNIMAQKYGSYKLRNRAARFAAAKIAHVNWMKMIFDCYAKDQCTTTEKLTDHTTCNFGKFYYGEGMETFKADPLFQQIEEPHKNVHAYGQQVVDFIRENKRSKAEESINNLMHTVEYLVGILDELIEKYNRLD